MFFLSSVTERKRDNVSEVKFNHFYWLTSCTTARVLSLHSYKNPYGENRGEMGRYFVATGRMATLQLVGLVNLAR